VAAIVGDVRPEYIFHLAAQPFVPLSLSDPAGTLVNNILGELHIFQAVIEAQLSPRIMIVGSGEEYGLIQPDEIPVSESNPLRPNSPYATSKVAQDMLALQYFITHKLQTVRVRAFNHVGPRQSPDFVVSNFARQIAVIEAGLHEPVVKVGNLEARRDLTDVRDMVRAYHLAITKGAPGEVYNIGYGRAVAVQDVLDALVAMTHADVRVEQDPSRMRPADVPIVVCDSSRFRAQTGWEPEIPLEQSLRDTLDYWRAEIGADTTNRS
jgi:GDP-4-dehydro-6-deoxy-D-mannose reductase